MLCVTAGHNRVTHNIYAALRSRLHGTPCSYYGPDLGVQTSGPEVGLTTSKTTMAFGASFSVSRNFDRREDPLPGCPDHLHDRIEKVREYQRVLSILRYVIVESSTAGVQVLHRDDGESPWTLHALIKDDVLDLPEIGIEFPVAEIYEDLDFHDADVDDAGA